MGLGAIKALTAPRLWVSFSLCAPRVLGSAGAPGCGVGQGALRGIWVQGVRAGCWENWGVSQGALGSTGGHCKGHWGAL